MNSASVTPRMGTCSVVIAVTDVVLKPAASSGLRQTASGSGDIWRVLFDKADAEVYDKIKMGPKGQAVVVYGVLYRWFTDVSGLGLAEQARMLMHPVPPKRGLGVGGASGGVAG